MKSILIKLAVATAFAGSIGSAFASTFNAEGDVFNWSVGTHTGSFTLGAFNYATIDQKFRPVDIFYISSFSVDGVLFSSPDTQSYYQTDSVGVPYKLSLFQQVGDLATEVLIDENPEKNFVQVWDNVNYKQVYFDNGGGGAGIFFQSHATASAVPEPEVYAMFLAGLGVVGFAVRRRDSI